MYARRCALCVSIHVCKCVCVRTCDRVYACVCKVCACLFLCTRVGVCMCVYAHACECVRVREVFAFVRTGQSREGSEPPG